VSFGFPDQSIALDFGRAPLTERLYVTPLVGDRLRVEDVDLHAQAGEVLGGFPKNLLAESIAVFYQLVDRQGADHTTKVCFQRFPRDRLDLVGAHAEEPRAGGQKRLPVIFEADVGDGLDRDENAVGIGHVFDPDLRERYFCQIKKLDLFDDRPTYPAAAGDHHRAGWKNHHRAGPRFSFNGYALEPPSPAARAVEEGRLIGGDPDIERRQGPDQNEQGDDRHQTDRRPSHIVYEIIHAYFPPV
jgi:hypothetical protein